ncbi:hypothetical protein SCATT_35550 [Streptantibioticus cattleyicolor NRRL 8057 = DSM 46488]|uniref:Uncharacterized protein n=1 Tax=Streptantibioticus cattleyicolor (strain ATCC 35852 / DSM 46488 / JCM 4925 / NBRC 14057 / NRRL 8057) TaxID=1003195 RepID=G8WX21_STREN|nr:hypothetical protein SCATT_35550 [Streptantibioticus cattleyicolor NRRL 8057 = DSM 46488]
MGTRLHAVVGGGGYGDLRWFGDPSGRERVSIRAGRDP